VKLHLLDLHDTAKSLHGVRTYYQGEDGWKFWGTFPLPSQVVRASQYARRVRRLNQERRHHR
jgi:hypothetical protein